MSSICNNCIFKDRKKIPYRGKVPCDIMIVGEAPAETEELLGKPFVGDSGKVLNHAIKYNRLDKYRLLIANALKCRIYKDRDKTKDINAAMKLCKKFLEAAIRKAKPKLIVCLGAYALKQIIGRTEVLANRGRVFQTQYGIPAFASVHPSFILRQSGRDFYKKDYKHMTPVEKMLVDDFKVIKDMADNGFKEVNYKGRYIEASIEDLKELLKCKRLAVDIETDGLGYGNKRKVLSISFSPDKAKSFVVVNPSKSKLEVINRILKNENIIKIVANRPFDEIMWEKIYGVKWKGTIHDVLVMAHLVDENLAEGYNLESVAHNYTDLKNIKDEAQGLRKEIDKMDKETLIRYNGIDTDATFRAYKELSNIISKNPKLKRYYSKFIMPVLDMYADITGIGFKIDEEDVNKSEEDLKRIADELHNKAINKIPKVIRIIHEDKGLKLSRAELIRDVLFMSNHGFKLKPKKFTAKTKLPATDEGHLKEFAGNEFVDLLLEWKKVDKLLTTYIKQIREAINEDGKIYPNTLFFNTVTGRTVVLNPAIQTIPQRSKYAKYIKRIFKAPEGFMLCARDLAQSELRIAGWIANDKNILEALNKGIDLHTKTAAIVNKININEVTKDMRQKAKPINFGFLYGMSAKSFVRYAKEEYGQVFTQEEAEEVRKAFFAKPNGYYNLPVYHQKMINMARKKEYVISPLGRYRRLPTINSMDNMKRAEAERQAINFPIQSFSSDLALIGKMLFYKWISEELLSDKIIPLWFIHDAVLFLALEDIWEEAHKKLKHIYLEEAPEYIEKNFGVKITYPVESDGKIGKNWAEMNELDW